VKFFATESRDINRKSDVNMLIYLHIICVLFMYYLHIIRALPEVMRFKTNRIEKGIQDFVF
jgi:hypothetical protein